MHEKENESDDQLIVPRDAFWQVKYKLRTVEAWRRDQVDKNKEYEDRIRELEDWKLSQHTRMRDFIKWVSILVAAITAAINLLGHISFK
jgi:hypothetical protein